MTNRAQYWKSHGPSYRSQLDGPYHSHRLAVVRRLIDGLSLPSSRSVDFGCGDGVVTEHLARNGAVVTGIDIDRSMCLAARRRLRVADLDGDVRNGGLETLSSLEAGSVDNLVAINVVGYLTDQEERQFYAEASRVVKSGGGLVVMAGNELFDLYTLNAHTATFHAKHFGRDGRRVDRLLTHPNEPDRERRNIYNNPLTYRHMLRRYGFEEAQQEFANLHPLPPLLMDPAGFADIDRRDYVDTLGWDESERWKLLFMCAMFGSRAVRR